MDLIDLLESGSLDLGLPATFEYDLVIGLSSLTGLGLGSLIVADGLLQEVEGRWKDARRRQEGLQRQNNAKKGTPNAVNCSITKEPPQTSNGTQTRLSPTNFSGL